MPVKYDFSLSEFPNNDVDGGVLHEEVDNTTISGFLYINTDPNGAEVWFENTLTSGDESILDGVIATHSGVEPPLSADNMYTAAIGVGYVPISDGGGSTEWTPGAIAAHHRYDYRMAGSVSDEYIQTVSAVWTNIGDFIFEGTNGTPVTDFETICWVNDAAVTGYIRLYDYTHNIEVAFVTCSGLSKALCEVNVHDMPATESILEIQMKVERDGPGKKIFRVSAVSLY